MKWLDNFIYGLQVDRQAIAEREKYKTVTAMAVRGFRDLVAKRLKKAHGVTLDLITREDAPAKVAISFYDDEVCEILQDVNDDFYKSIDDAVKTTAKHLWETWNSRFSQEPKLMRRYEDRRGYPADD
jgi:hypothetical protein